MIISASRRTDIPAFYAPWFMNRIRAGFCTVPNPFNRNQVSRISLLPQDVDVIVFWTRNARPLLEHLTELDERCYRYYFQYTILDNPRPVDQKTPPLEQAIATFQAVTEHAGPQRVIWRYDPIVLSEATGVAYHLDRYAAIAEQLAGCTTRSVISVLDRYKKAETRLRRVAEQGIAILEEPADAWPGLAPLMAGLVEIATTHGMEIVSCAEEIDLARYGVRPGKCIDDDYIYAAFGLRVGGTKDPSQRAACGCVASRDIGMYDSCLFGCQYCYATSSFDRARANHATHDPLASSLLE